MSSVVTNPRILCLGELLFDCLSDQVANSMEEVKTWTSFPGGAPANVACALVKLGISAGFIGCVGNDQSGNQLVEVLTSLGVNISGIQRHPTKPTRKIYVLRSSNGDRSFAGFGHYFTSDFADTDLDSLMLSEKLFEDAEYLVLGTLELAYPHTRAAVFRALELADLYHLKIVVDVNWRPMFWPDPNKAKSLITQLWPYVDFLKLSAEEANWLFHSNNAGEISRQLDSVEGVIITNGSENISYCINDYEGIVSPFWVKVEDTLGAGDAFLAGFIHQLCLRGISSLNQPKIIKEMISYAAAVGSLTTTKSGAIAAQPTFLEVDAFLQEINHN